MPTLLAFSIQKAHPPTPLHPIINFSPFAKCGIDFMHCNPTSAGGHDYIIVSINYFTKWAEEMPMYAKDGKTVALFLFNHVIARFGVLQAILTDHRYHFRNQMMAELSAKLVFLHEKSTLYYP